MNDKGDTQEVRQEENKINEKRNAEIISAFFNAFNEVK